VHRQIAWGHIGANVEVRDDQFTQLTTNPHHVVITFFARVRGRDEREWSRASVTNSVSWWLRCQDIVGSP